MNPIIRVQWQQMLAVACPACPALPGERCDPETVPTWEWWHIARAMAAEREAR